MFHLSNVTQIKAQQELFVVVVVKNASYSLLVRTFVRLVGSKGAVFFGGELVVRHFPNHQLSQLLTVSGKIEAF